MKRLALFCVVFAVTLKPFLNLPFSSYLEQRLQQQNLQISDLQYDFYSETCPQVEQIIRSTMNELYFSNPSVAPQLLRLLFHDCFIGGCDASILLEKNLNNNEKPEKVAIPNETLKGFEKIEMIKSRLEEACPGIVSCADALALAAREGILLAGGPFYPLLTGRKDSYRSYHDTAENEIPSPNSNITTILTLFASRGFNERETVSLLGAHSIGQIDCQFIQNRLFNFSGTGQPDPSVPQDFLYQLRANCSGTKDSSMSYYQLLLPSMSSGSSFDAHYYRSLLRGRGLLFSDQQLMYKASTARLVEAYASDNGVAFRRDFGRVMIKLSSLRGSTSDQGPVRLNCSKLN